MNRRKVALISLDSLSDTEFERLKTLKNFSKIMKKGVYCKNSTSVYPTQTYTVHTSVITGNYPNKHGVYNNQPFQPFVQRASKEWFWFRNQIKSDTLYDIAHANKLSVCSLLWPVSGGAKIKYNMPEIIAVEGEDQTKKVLRYGSPLFIIPMEIKYGKYRQGTAQPQLDEYAKMCAVDIIKSKSPDLLMLHLVSMDTAKHNYSVESEKVTQSLKILDRMLGEILAACSDEYTIVLFSDHGQFTLEYDVHINAFLAQHGMLNFTNKTYRAYIECMDGCGVLRATGVKAIEDAMDLIIEHMEYLGISAIYERDTLDALNVSKDIKCMIEAKPGYRLVDTEADDIVRDLKKENIHIATHGYNPTLKDYKCLFFAMGEGIKQNVQINKMNVVDIAPTVAKLLDIDMDPCDGNTLEEIFT